GSGGGRQLGDGVAAGPERNARHPAGDLAAIVEAELVEDLAHVPLGRAPVDEQAGRDGAIGQPLGAERRALAFAPAQRRPAAHAYGGNGILASVRSIVRWRRPIEPPGNSVNGSLMRAV